MIDSNLHPATNGGHRYTDHGSAALKIEDDETKAALDAFVIALAKHYARIDHLEMEAANDNTLQ
ncbi:hypothetical protein ACKWRH_28360 [Bradyrhizobium sp. Pa8]|uniref:hypothetical protein n=1 Tax=Bradyrhizobium sp. Pa8 TaxID=3386552 RepID=UPI00403EF9F8